MRPCGCLPSYIFLGQNCVKFYEVTKRPRLIQFHFYWFLFILRKQFRTCYLFIDGQDVLDQLTSQVT
jgi:hypothetical protein